MRTATTAYTTERRRLATEPRYIARFYHVPDQTSATQYPFSVDFASGSISASTKTKLPWIEAISGVSSSIQPEQGRASIGGYTITFADHVDEQVLKYFAQPELVLAAAISAGATSITLTGAAAGIDASGLPDPPATIELTAADTADPGRERIRYTAKDDTTGVLSGLTRGADGTTARAWAASDRATNGEQIRPGQRVILLCGYAGVAEADFMPLPLMSVYQRALSPVTQAGYTVEFGDILRTLRQQIFLNASPGSPLILEAHPIDIALQILISTGLGTNGTHDVLAAENSLGIPEDFIDVDSFGAALDETASDRFCFHITQPENAKEWLEREIFKPTNAYPIVIQGGKLAVRLYTPVTDEEITV